MEARHLALPQWPLTSVPVRTAVRHSRANHSLPPVTPSHPPQEAPKKVRSSRCCALSSGKGEVSEEVNRTGGGTAQVQKVAGLAGPGDSTDASPSYTEEFATRKSADAVREEMLLCYNLVQRLGRGAVYLGSSRTPKDHPHFHQARDLARQVALLLRCTTWTGIGPGMMDAATLGGLEAGTPVGGLKIAREAGEWVTSFKHPYLPPHTYVTTRFFSARKHGLVDAGVREREEDRTAYVALPGGIGSLDEIFEILTLIQLERLGSKFPVPFILMNYDGAYRGLVQLMEDSVRLGALREGEVEALWKVCRTNAEAIDYLTSFYNIRSVNT